MRRIAFCGVVLVVVGCGVIAISRFMHRRSESVKALVVIAPAVNAALVHEGFRVELEQSDDTMGAISGVDSSGARVLVVWGQSGLHGVKLSASVKAAEHDDYWRSNCGGPVLAAITSEVTQRWGYPVNEHSDLPSATEALLYYEPQ